MALHKVSRLIWLAGIILIVLSWLGLVSNVVGWVGFVAACVGIVLSLVSVVMARKSPSDRRDDQEE